MAVETVTKVTCDVCNAEMSPIHKNEKTKMTVVFTTEQTEGRSVRPYLTLASIDICNKCEQVIIDEGRILFAHGAQGHNKYYFNDRDENG